MHDCRISRDIWKHIGFTDAGFFAFENVSDWLKEGANGRNAIPFTAGLWWIWICRNTMCINNEQMPIHRVAANIRNATDSILYAFPTLQPSHLEQYCRWNNNNFDCTILNVDGSCLGSPTRAGFGGLIRNSAGFYLAGFSGFIPSSSDILQAELSAIYFGLSMASDLGYAHLACYSDSMLVINTIKEGYSKYHVYAVLIHEIQELLSHENVSLHHTLREGNQCADFLAKLGASSDVKLMTHMQPPDELRPLLSIDAIGTMFLRA
jgi:ribonuclease HI